MHFKGTLTHYASNMGGGTHSFCNGERCDVRSISKPDINSARFSYLENNPVRPNDTTTAIITPYCPEMWKSISVGETLYLSLHLNVLGECLVTEIIPEKSK